MKYIVMAHRASSSVFGPGHAPLKSNGELLVFDTREAAVDKQLELNKKLSHNPHVWYTVSEIHG